MFDLFLNPWAMAAGGLLVSSPIIIHLINRMRFKRIQWAAMEFLLKAQKRMRRKMIIEQLILLLLRILLVLLVGLLVGRYMGFAGTNKESKPAKHLVLLDDSPSMADFWRGDDGQMTDAFKQAKKQVTEQIVPAAAQASTAQTMELLRLSDLGDVYVPGRLNSGTAQEIQSRLVQYEPSKVRVGLAEGLKKAKERFDADASEKDVTRILHVLSDFRSIDWAQDGEAIKAAVRDLTAGQVQVHLIDVAHPFRREDKKTPLFHENVGIVELKPKGRVVAKDQPVEFSVKIKNFGNTELKDVRCAILVNGDENRGLSLYIPTLPANQDKELPFNLQFSQTASDKNPLERFNLVTARLELTEPGGLEADNVRHAVVEVRDRISVLVVEGTDPSLRDKKEADGFYLKRVFLGSIGGINWVSGTVRDLETKDLRDFSSVYLLNVPDVSEAAVKNLEGYVREGGGLGVFLGPKVKPEAYNKLLYKDGTGLFPVPLPAKASDPPQGVDLLRSFTQKILLRDPASKDHPAVRGLYRDALGNPINAKDVEKFYNLIKVNQYWPIKRLGKWREDKDVKEIYCLPSEMPMGEAQTIVEPLLRKLREQIQQPKYQPYRQYLDQPRPVEEGKKPEKPMLDQIRDIMITSDPVALLAIHLDRLLCDQGTTGDPGEPFLREFWALPEMADLRGEFIRIRDTVKFGDPLYLTKQYGTGRVTAMTTTAGEEWTDWPSGWGNASFAPVMGELQKYLAGGGSDENLACGAGLQLTFNPEQYKPTATRTRLTFDGGKDKPARPGQSAVTVTELGDQPLTADKGRLVLDYKEAAVPGAYVFTLTRLRDANAGPKDPGDRPEYVAYAFNVDAQREGDLRRANRDDISQLSEKVPMHSPDDANWTDDLKQKANDLSGSRWLYLVLILLLVAEQAMAVRLSHHTQPGELEAHAPTAAAALHRGAAPAAEPVTSA